MRTLGFDDVSFQPHSEKDVSSKVDGLGKIAVTSLGVRSSLRHHSTVDSTLRPTPFRSCLGSSH